MERKGESVMNILLVCACGLSTSLLAQKIETEMEREGENGKVWAADIDSVSEFIVQNSVDCLLLAPQVHFARGEVKSIVDKKSIPMLEISSMDYGRINAEKIWGIVKKKIRE